MHFFSSVARDELCDYRDQLMHERVRLINRLRLASGPDHSAAGDPAGRRGAQRPQNPNTARQPAGTAPGQSQSCGSPSATVADQQDHQRARNCSASSPTSSTDTPRSCSSSSIGTVTAAVIVGCPDPGQLRARPGRLGPRHPRLHRAPRLRRRTKPEPIRRPKRRIASQIWPRLQHPNPPPRQSPSDPRHASRSRSTTRGLRSYPANGALHLTQERRTGSSGLVRANDRLTPIRTSRTNVVSAGRRWRPAQVEGRFSHASSYALLSATRATSSRGRLSGLPTPDQEGKMQPVMTPLATTVPRSRCPAFTKIVLPGTRATDTPRIRRRWRRSWR
jgi:hypothetical protein